MTQKSQGRQNGVKLKQINATETFVNSGIRDDDIIPKLVMTA